MEIERRRHPRFPAVENVAVVEFRRGGRPRIVQATLVNINTTGALLRMPERPGIDASLWIRLIHPVETPTIRATAVWIGDGGKLGVAFAHDCNRTFFWTATRGAASVPSRRG